MFQTYIERPIFNLLEFIYATIPGHDLGLSIIIFTVIVRTALWPFVKRQLHQTKAMRKLQPELKRIKKAAAGDRQKLARLQMELYKEHGVKPFTTIGTLIIQLPIFIALFFSIRKMVEDSNSLLTFAYEPVRNLPWIETLAADMSKFEHTLLGVVDLSRSGLEGGLYIPAVIVALVASITQFYQSKMMLPDKKDHKGLSAILKDVAEGKQADQSDISAAVSRGMIFFLPFITFIFSIALPSALALYIWASAGVGILQQRRVFKKDEEELEEISEENEDVKIETSQAKPAPAKKRKSSKKKRKKRR